MTDAPATEVIEPVTEIKPNLQIFDIDDDNMVFNGDAYFWLGDVKILFRTFQAPPPPPAPPQPLIPTIAFCLLNSQFGFPFADIAQRDEIFEELKKRMHAIKNGTIGQYINKLKKAREK